MTDDNKRVYKSVKTGKRFTISTPHHTEPNQQGGKRGDTSDNWGDKPNQLDEQIIKIWEREFTPKHNNLPIPQDFFNDLVSLIAKAQTTARINGEIKGLSTYACLDQESFRKNTKWIKVDSSDVLKKITNLIAQLNRKDSDG